MTVTFANILALAVYVWESWAVSVNPHYVPDWGLAVRFAAVNKSSLTVFDNSALIDEADREMMKVFRQMADTNSYIHGMMKKTVAADIRNEDYTKSVIDILRFAVNETRRSYTVDNDVKGILTRFMTAAKETIEATPVNNMIVINVGPVRNYFIQREPKYRR